MTVLEDVGLEMKRHGELTHRNTASLQKRAAEFDADAPARQAPGGGSAKPSAAQPAAQPQRSSKPSAPCRDPNAAGMRPPKTGVVQRDKMRELLTDALVLALDDVPDGQPGASLWSGS